MRGRGASDLILVSSHLSTRHLRPGDRLSSPALSRLAFHKRFSPGWDNCRAGFIIVRREQSITVSLI